MKVRTLFAACLFASLAPAANGPVPGLASSRGSFAVSKVDTRPEAGPLPLVDGDEIVAGINPVYAEPEVIGGMLKKLQCRER